MSVDCPSFWQLSTWTLHWGLHKTKAKQLAKICSISTIIGSIFIWKTMALILEHFLKFLLKCFLRASEKQRKQKTSAKFMHA